MSELLPCKECGMLCDAAEFHPYAACLMFKACWNSETVRENLEYVMNRRANREVDDAMVGAFIRAYVEHRGTYEGEIPVDPDDVRDALTAALEVGK